MSLAEESEMYTLVKAVLREKGLNTVWQQVDILNMNLMTLLNRFASGHIELTNPTLDGIQYVDYETLKAAKLPLRNVTFVQWLAFIGNRTIPASSTAPVYTKHNITFADAWAVGFRPKKCHPVYGLDYKLFDDQNTDIYISRPNVQSDIIADYALFTVNGFVHLPIPFKNGLRLVNGMQTVNNMTKNRIGVISFEKVGKLTHVKLTEDMISKSREEFNYSSGVFIHLHKDIRNKSLMFTSLGYLNPGAEVMEIINAEIGLVKLNIQRLNLLNRVLSSKKHLGYDIGLTEYDSMPGAVSRKELMSDAVILNILTSDYSFITIVDTPVLYFEHKPVSNVPLFGFYELSTFPKYPLVDHLGRIMEFVAVKKDEFYTIRAEEAYQKRYQYETETIRTQDIVNDIVAVNGYIKEIGHQLIIGSMIRTTA